MANMFYISAFMNGRCLWTGEEMYFHTVFENRMGFAVLQRKIFLWTP